MRLILLTRAIFSPYFLPRLFKHGKPFYNWNSSIEGSKSFVLQNLSDLLETELGQRYEVSSVNRSTGKVTMRLV